MGAFIGLISISVRALNLAGVVVGGIWLAALGKWSLVCGGFAVLVLLPKLGVFLLALAPGWSFSRPGALAMEKGHLLFGGALVAVGSLWTYAVMAAWCLGSFYVVFSDNGGESIWPYLLWAYSTATGPWIYMARRGGGTPSYSLAAFAACVGSIAVMGVILVTPRMAFGELLTAFCIPLTLAFVVRTWMLFEFGRAAKPVFADE